MDQVSHRFSYCGVFRSRTGKQSNKTPGSLRSRARPLTLRRRHVVTEQRFAETAVHFLDAAEPVDGALAEFARGKGNRFEGAQDAARSINIIHAPAAEPRTVFRLILQQKIHGSPNDRVAVGPTEAAETLNNARGDISGRSEEHTSELQSLRHLVCRLLLE